jgi:RNA polymerase sigma factor (sigma-70 family)
MSCHTSEPSNVAGEDESIMARLVGSHREFLSFLEKRLGDRALAEDILQDAFVKGVERSGQVTSAESATAWFYQMLRNAVIDHHRRGSANRRKLESLAAELASPVPPEDVERAVCRCVGEVASTLKSEYAEALRRIEIEGVAVKDFAVEAGITSGNAAVRVFRAREALRRQVKRSCGTCAEHGCVDCTCRAGSTP